MIQLDAGARDFLNVPAKYNEAKNKFHYCLPHYLSILHSAVPEFYLRCSAFVAPLLIHYTCSEWQVLQLDAGARDFLNVPAYSTMKRN